MPNSKKRKGRNSYQRRRRVQHLILRDGLDCCLCGVEMDPTLKHPNVMAITIHHVIPYSVGGHCGLDNLKLAHYDCNWEDGHKKELETRNRKGAR